VLSANTVSSAGALTGMTCIIMGSRGAIAISWTQPTIFITGLAATGAIALINSMGNLSGFIKPEAVVASLVWGGYVSQAFILRRAA
jgi:MFS transporter, ACS family, tartrate transporter